MILIIINPTVFPNIRVIIVVVLRVKILRVAIIITVTATMEIGMRG